jgi:hypothetical protein
VFLWKNFGEGDIFVRAGRVLKNEVYLDFGRE